LTLFVSSNVQLRSQPIDNLKGTLTFADEQQLFPIGGAGTIFTRI